MILDGYANLAESDTVYTHNLMCKDKMDYKVRALMELGKTDNKAKMDFKASRMRNLKLRVKFLCL